MSDGTRRFKGNILSAIIRQAWDGGNLNPLTKNSPIKATDAHISVIGHITREELLRYLSATEQANGFANRFIWLMVYRSKCIPNPTGIPDEILSMFVEQLSERVEQARRVNEIRRDDAAEKIWSGIYPSLSEGRPGLLGAVMGRAEAQVCRLACLYALIDGRELVGVEHLSAALALWDYSEKSAAMIFGDLTGNAMADRIYAALAAGDLTDTDIHDLFGRHKASSEIDAALMSLVRSGRAKSLSVSTAGRPKTVWHRSELSEER